MGVTSRIVVIGVGNRDRGDDAVGPIVCDRIGELDLPDVESIVFEGSVLDISIHWSTVDRVFIVDAAEPAGEPGRITEVDGRATRLVLPGQLSTHTIDVGAAIELARALDRLPAELTIIGIEGAEFEFGAWLTSAVEHAADTVVATLERRAADPERASAPDFGFGTW
jgi:hydrogenase maturation protease